LNQALLTSKSVEWSTPQDFFDRINRVFQFELDVCATAENAKAARFFTKETDGLAHPWAGRVWMNPPYGRGINKWITKAWGSARAGASVVCLIPARTDTKWFQDVCLPHGDIHLVRGRLKFGGCKTNAPFPCAVVGFNATEGLSAVFGSRDIFSLGHQARLP
jgi:phage N-6-adenine-methyltransferase